MDSAEIVSSDSDIGAVLSGVPHDQWIQLPVSGFLQPARRNHSAEVVDGKLYVAGGSRNGRRLSDFQVKQGNKLNKLLIVAGHVKGSSESVTVWSIDCALNQCNIMKTHGKVQIARGGQSVTLVGRRLLMFGGEDTRRRLMNDHHILDLETVVGFNRNHHPDLITQPQFMQSAT